MMKKTFHVSVNDGHEEYDIDAEDSMDALEHGVALYVESFRIHQEDYSPELTVDMAVSSKLLTTERAFTSAGLPYRPCGLNADWSCRAWHLGPGKRPNMQTEDGPQLYLLQDDGGHSGTDDYLIVRRHPDPDPERSAEQGEIETLHEGLTLGQAMDKVRSIFWAESESVRKKAVEKSSDSLEVNVW